ncbi:InlB B-repeat-containing protein [Bifidobacterium oedipodis]|uniref:Cell wall surface anchor family protein n=1 Tax=Bifidobacterium oedipodis TaxID=2675322 RepID=A0A7Y0ERB2_9BIFI|nr:InlB B-repeat-containing protein [Bifidobacterium sp. DSM 109957]NMM95003.1 Cell wall surface anchor family protein [Bifidobacterium sp. DSM 109957]
MTGNKNAWRAPLAGLASVAMIATMGVAAATANAAVVDESDNFSVKVYEKDRPYGKWFYTSPSSMKYGETFDTTTLKDPYAAAGDGKVLTGYSFDLAGNNVAKSGFAVKGDTKLYAQYADAVKVTFKSTQRADGSLVTGAAVATTDQSFDVAKGAGVTAEDYNKYSVTEPDAAAKPGYVFVGWKLTDDADAQDIYQGGALSADTTLYPVFEKYQTIEDQNNVAKVFFDVPDTTAGDVVKYTVTNKPFPAYRAPEGTWLDASGNSYDFSANVDSDKNEDVYPTTDPTVGVDLTLEKFTSASDNAWTVNYDFGKPNGTKVDPTNDVAGADVFNTDGDQVSGEYLAADDKAEQPADPAVKNAVFTGWYDAAGNKVDFNVPVSQQPAADTEHRFLEVHAGWDTKNVAAVAYYYGYYGKVWNNTDPAGKTDLVKGGKALDYVTTGNAIPQPTGVEDYYQTAENKDHNTYTTRKVTAWKSVADNADITKVTASTSVYAKWDSAASILLNGNGGSFSNGNNYIYATKTDSQKWEDVIETPTRAGKTFKYWTDVNYTTWFNTFDGKFYNLSDGTVNPYKLVDGDTLVAQWSDDNQDEVAAFTFKYDLSYTNQQRDVAKLVKEGYTKASATKFVAQMYKLFGQYVSYDQLPQGQARKDAAAKLVAAYQAAEKLLVRQDAAEVPAGTEPVYRAYNPYMKVGSTHLFTTDEQEYKAAKDAGWIGEGIAFYTTTSKDAQKVYRLYNKYDGSHHYTTDKAERDNLLEVGWTDEGVAWYAASDAPDSVYRAYNKYNGEHLFTLDADEMKNIVSVGWIDEGVAFKATAAE